MGQIVLSSELSGRSFGFNIAGDKPTVDEQMYIDNIMRQQDAQFIEEYKTQFGESPTDEGEGIANYAGEIFKGIGRGGVNLLEQAALGAAAVLPEEQELAAREAIRETAYGLKPQADIGMEDTVGGKFGEGLGSFVPLLATSLIPGVGLPLATGLAVGAGAGEASERARAAGATEEERNLATRFGAGVGATEVLPLKLGMLDKILEGSGLKKRAGRILQQAGIEGLQEFAANTAQNLIEQEIYNPEKELGEGGLEAAGYGAGVGGFVQLVADLLVPGRRRVPTTPTQAEKQAVEAATTTAQEQQPPQPQQEPFELTPLDVYADEYDYLVDPEDKEATDAVTGVESEGARAGVPSSELGVGGSERGVSGVGDTTQPTAPDAGAVGTGVLDADGVDAAARVQRDTLTEEEAFELAAQEFGASRTPAKDVEFEQAVEAQKELNKAKAQAQEDVIEAEAEPTTPSTARQVIPGFIYPTDPKTLQPSGKPYPESDPRYSPVAAPKATPAELEPSKLTPEPTAVPAIPTMEVLDELGVSKGTAAYQIAKNRLAESIANNDRDAIRADVADIFGALGKLKTKDAQLKARVDEYVGKATPKEEVPAARERRAETRQLRERAIREEVAKVDKREGQQVARDEARAREEAAAAERIAASQGAVSPKGMEVAADATREQIVQDYMKNRPRASLGQEPVRGVDPKKTEEELFSEFVRKNVKIPTPEGGTRPVESVSELTDVQLADALDKFNDKKLTDVADQILTGKLTKEKNAKRARMKRGEFRAWLKENYTTEEIDGLSKAASKKELDEIYEGYVQGTKALKELAQGFDPNWSRLKTEATVGLNLPLDPDTMTMLEDGNLADALRRYADQAPNPIVAKMAKALSRLTGTTRVVFADIPGGRVTGAYNPRTNTIVFNQNIPLVGHTLMHEMLHAATISQIVNAPNKAAAKQLNNIFNEVRDKLPSTYGSESLVEFVAEAFSNPKFQSQLAALRLTGAKGSLLDQLKRAVARIVNFVKGQPTISAMGEVEALVDGLLAPAPEYMDVDTLYNIANDPADARRSTNAAIMNGPIFDAKEGNKMLAWLEDTSRGGISDGYNAAKTIALRALPLHYLVDLGKKYFSSNLMDTINDTMNKASGRMQEDYDATEAIVGDMVRWANNNPDQVEAFNTLVNDSTIYQVDPEMSEAEAVRKYAEDPIALDIHRRLRELFKEVGPDGQKQYRQTRNFFRKMRVDLQNAVANRLSQAGVPEAVQNRILRDFYSKLTQRGAIEPYFPLTRKGDNWLFFSAVDPNTGVIEYYAEAFETEAQRNRAWSEMRGDIIRDMMQSEQGQQRMQSLRQDASVNTEGMSDEQVAELATGLTATLTIPNQWYNNTPNTSFINQLMSELSVAPVAENPAAAELRQQTMDEVSKLILNTLPETSYIQSFRKRKEGEVAKAALSNRQDAVRTISDRAKSLTRQIVEMEYNAEFNRLNSQLDQELRNRVGKPAGISRAEAAVYKELAWFTRNGVKQKHTQLSRALTGIAFNMTLGFNVSGGLINLSQMPLIVYPMLAAKHGPVKTMRAMGTAMKIMRNGGLSRKIEGVSDAVDADGNPILEEKTIKAAISMANYDFTDPNLPADILELKELVETGIDLGQFKRSLDYEILDIDQMSGFWAKFNKASGFFLHHGERVNREVTMIASYKLALDNMTADERADPMMRREAAKQAVADAEMMNGGLAANATPRLAQNDLGRVVFMYKKYGVTMLSLLHKLARESLKGQTPEARRLAMLQLGGIYGSAGVLSGVAGMPLFGTLSMAWDALFDDEDEEGDSLDELTRLYLGEGPYRGALNYMTGVNIASRVGLGDFLFRDTIVRKDMPLIWQYAETVGGPFIGVYLNAERGAKLMGEGEFYRGFEAMSPAAIKNGLKAIRYYKDEGIETVKGNTIIGDLHPAHLAAQVFGFTPAEYSRQLEINMKTKGAERATVERRNRLLNKYFKAVFDDDYDTASDILDAIDEYNSDHPDYPITSQTLQRSMKSRINNKKEQYHGLTFNSRLRDRYVQYMEEYGDNPSLFF